MLISNQDGNPEKLEESDEEEGEGFKIKLKQTLRAPSNHTLLQGSNTPTPNKGSHEQSNLVIENDSEETQNFNSNAPLNPNNP
jgi:hypothetical protein